jgi:ureidoglycolate lyase
MHKLTPIPLTQASFAPYGFVVEPPHGAVGVAVNEGSARRFDHIGDVQNLRPASAKLNVSFFRCMPRVMPFTVRVLEKHPMSTQLFVPLGAERYIVIVARGGDAPDLTTLAAFDAHGRQGIAYHPGIWHQSLMALDRETDFHCVVWEDGSADDCILHQLPEAAYRTVY